MSERNNNMKIVEFKPFQDTDGTVTGYIHTSVSDDKPFREKYPAVVVCPGGGYEMVSKREGDPIALRYLSAGYNVFILTYSVKEKAKNFTPLKELSETFCIIRDKCEEWSTDPNKIAVCGFSAGGHLSASLGTLWNHPRFLKEYDNKGGLNKPNGMILSYAVISADEFGHSTSIANVSGHEPGEEEFKFFSLEKQVTKETCPAFLWHTAEDDVVPVQNSLRMATALQEHGIPFECHIFPHGHHGISACTEEVNTPFPHNAHWLDMSIRWLNQLFNYTL